jgi:RNA polymerase sigma-B factor
MSEELHELLGKFFTNRDTAIRDKIILSQMDLVLKIVRRFSRWSGGLEDLYQVGYIGLIKAIDSYEPQRQVQFNTYATHCILGEIRHYLRDSLELVRKPRWLQKLKAQINEFMEGFLQKYQRLPTPAEISKSLNIKEEGVIEVLKSHAIVSLGNEYPLGEKFDFTKVKGLSYQNFKLPLEDKILLAQALEKLKVLERRIVYLFFFQDLTQMQIGELVGISHKKVSRLLQQIMEKLKNFLAQDWKS